MVPREVFAIVAGLPFLSPQMNLVCLRIWHPVYLRVGVGAGVCLGVTTRVAAGVGLLVIGSASVLEQLTRTAIACKKTKARVLVCIIAPLLKVYVKYCTPFVVFRHRVNATLPKMSAPL